eukprot:1311187-Prymnesium_polylepis.1
MSAPARCSTGPCWTPRTKSEIAPHPPPPPASLLLPMRLAPAPAAPLAPAPAAPPPRPAAGGASATRPLPHHLRPPWLRACSCAEASCQPLRHWPVAQPTVSPERMQPAHTYRSPCHLTVVPPLSPS